jgi:aspartate racemase
MTMKIIGLIGGMTWHSTIEYYRLINAGVQSRLGGSHSAQCILYSLDFQDLERQQIEGGWDAIAETIADAARSVERAGADALLICANTMHRVARIVEAAVSIPLIHIADAAAGEIQRQQLRTVGLLGTRFTMEQEFYRERLESHHGLRVLIPEPEERNVIHRVIYEELGHGLVLDRSRELYREIITRLKDRGAEGVILGCTEIPLLVKPEDSAIPSFDTTALHAAAAVEFATRS